MTAARGPRERGQHDVHQHATSAAQRALQIILLVSLVLAYSNPAVAADPVVRVGSKSFTESVILGEMLTHLAEDAGAETLHRAEVGGTEILWKALQSGEVDVYPEYTGTILRQILPEEQLRGEEAIRAALRKRGVIMGGRLGFNNTYALGLREDVAERLKIRTIGDLKSHPDLKCGFSDEFIQRPDGWPGLKREYKLPQENPGVLDHTLAYRGLKTGSLDMMDLFSTDAEIQYYKLRTLEDDRGYFPQYEAVLLWRADLETKAPAVVQAFRKLEGQLSTETMLALNVRAKIDKAPESQVAGDFLEKSLNVAPRKPTSRSTGHVILDNLLTNGRQHLFLTAVSLTAAVLVAIPLGIIAHKFPKAGVMVMGVVGVIQTLPSMALLVFMIPLLGLGAEPAIVALFLYSLLPIVRNTATGMSAIAPGLRESAESLGLSSWSRLWRIELPLASPAILSGIKTAAVINVGTATIGALIGAGGFGQPILTGIRLDNTSLILQGAIPAAALALLVQGMFSLAERVVVPKGLRM